MRVKRYSNIDSFLQECLPFLEKNEALHNLHIGIPLSTARLEAFQNPLNLFALLDGQEVIFVCVQTPPQNLLITGKEDRQADIYKHIIPFLATQQIQTSGIIGPKDFTLEFATHWQQQTGQAWKVNFQQLIYQLDHLQTVQKSTGFLRKATLADLTLAEDWIIAFAKDAMNSSNIEKSKAVAKAKIEAGTLYFWDDERPVSMAAVARPSRNGITVNYVYTPPAYRGKGYASNCVAEMSQLMLEQYKFCCLFTDVTNPTSNKIYQKMGYYPIAEYSDIRFL